jgi:hypothetical protein
MEPVSTRALQLDTLAALTAVGGVLAGCKMHLFKNAIAPGPNTPLSSFEEADYAGYAAETVGVWGMPFFGIDARARIVAPAFQFQPTGGAAPNTIYGAYFTNAGSTVLLFAVRFTAPAELIDQSNAVVVEPMFSYGR